MKTTKSKRITIRVTEDIYYKIKDTGKPLQYFLNLAIEQLLKNNFTKKTK